MMQQTEIYQFNKIDMDDNFSPDPINENTEKLEAALTGLKDSLGQRITTLEGRRLAAGSYTGYYDGTTATMTPRTFQLGFTPAAVFVSNTRHGYAAGLALPGSDMSSSRVGVKIVSGGFSVMNEFNQSGMTFNYLALL